MMPADDPRATTYLPSAASAGAAKMPWTSSQWADYFRENSLRRAAIAWEDGVHFTLEQHRALATSLQQFQLGESGEGRHLLSCAREFSALTGDHAYVPAVCRFIAEAQRHARDLGNVLDLAGIPRIRRAWTDTVFRFLRRLAGLELSITVLLTAEILARIYYASIREATCSKVLRRVCDQILYDQQEHVRFQSERLALLRRSRRGWAISLGHAFHRIFFAGTCAVVWRKHRRAFRAGGCGVIDFARAAWEDLESAITQMDPRHCSFAGPERTPARFAALWCNAPTQDPVHH